MAGTAINIRGELGNTNVAQDTTYIIAKMIPRLEAETPIWEFANPSPFVNNAGLTARWRLMANTVAKTDALTRDETTKDNPQTINTSGVEAKIETYGSWSPIFLPDLKAAPRDYMDEVSKNFAYSGSLTQEKLLIAAADGSGTGFTPSMGAGTTNIQKSNASGGVAATLTAGDKLTAEEIAIATSTLYETNVKPKDGGQFILLAHSRPIRQLVTDVSTTRITWEQMHKYVSGINGNEALTKYAIGAVFNALIVRDNNINTATIDGITAYNNIMLGDYGLGCLKVGDSNPDIFKNMPGAQSTDNPHRKFGTIAWQFMAAPKLLQSACVLLLQTSQA